VASENATETQNANVCVTVYPKIWSGLLYTYLHLLLGPDKVSWESWQLITAIHDEGDGPLL
jgi:hypothetical protein